MKKSTLVFLLAVIVQMTYAQYKVEWTNVSWRININANNSLSRVDAGEEPTEIKFDRGANSFNTLSGDGWVEFTFQAVTANQYGLGLSFNYVIGKTASDLDYAFFYEGGAVTIRENNNIRKTVAVTSGTLLRISKEGNQITYYKNGLLEYTSLTAPSGLYWINATLFSGTSPVPVASFNSSVVLNAGAVLLDGTEEGRGEVHFTARGGTAPYSFSWADGFLNADRTGLLPAFYSLTITDAVSSASDFHFGLGFKIFWNPDRLNDNVVINGDNSLTKNLDTRDFTGGAASYNKLAVGRDGWVGFTTEGASNYRYAVGLSKGNESDANTLDMDYAITAFEGELRLYKSPGVKVYHDTQNKLREGEFLRLERRAGKVYCYRNTSLVYTFETETQAELMVDVSVGYGKSPVINASFAKPGAKVPPEYKPDENLEKNWIFTTVYDENGNIVGQTKSFSDYLGRSTQTQSKDIATENIFASQILYDAQGRAAITTLSAPIDNSAFNYKDKFIIDANEQQYGDQNYDGTKLNNPDAVGNTLAGTLGWYYSANNTIEPNTPVTGYPYARVEYDEEPGGGIKRSAGVGDQFRMGTGHESKGRSFQVLDELDHYLRLRSHFITGSSTVSSLKYRAQKAVSTDAHGKEAISFADYGGNLLATCLSGEQYEPLLVNVSLAKLYSLEFTITRYENVTVQDISSVRVFDLDAGAALIYNGEARSDFETVLPHNHRLQFIATSAFKIQYKTLNILNLRSSAVLENSAPSGQSPYVDVHVPSGGATFNVTNTGTLEVYNLQDYTGFEVSSTGFTLSQGYYRLVSKSGEQEISYGLRYGDFSYSYYDDAGALMASVTPNGVNLSSDGVPAFSESQEYNTVGWVLSATSVDEGKSEFVYRKDGTIRFSQNALQKAENKFSYTNYDRVGRLVEAGEYVMSSTEGEGKAFQNHHTTLADIKSNSILHSGALENRTREGGLDAERCAQRAQIWYDLPFEDAALNGRKQEFVLGKISKTENENATSWYSYDDRGRLTWMVQNIVGVGEKTIEYSYDHAGNVTEVVYQKGQPDAFYHHYTYNRNQGLKQVYTSQNGVNKTLRAQHSYYLSGGLKRVELENNLQGIDYVYTINGALKGINHADKDKDPGHDSNDIFGMTFQYHDNDYSGAGYQAGNVTSSHPDQFNGMLKSQAWHSPSNLNGLGAYGFLYDEKYQLKKAEFGSVTQGTSHPFTVNPLQAFEEGVSLYDKNGNIKELLRREDEGNISEDYGYDYETNTNRLDKITHGTTGGEIVDYTYDAIGQMIQQTKDGKTIKISYNVQGLVKEVKEVIGTSDQLLQSYHYDDRGNLVKKTTYNSGTLQKETYYVSDASGNVLAIYEKPTSGTLTLAEIPIYGAGRIGVYKPTESTYFYEINDHLGNVRAVIGKPETENPTHNFETTSNGGFTNYHRVVNDLYDHTDAGKTYQYVHQLNGGINRQIGMTRSFEVFPGDIIKADVFAKYEGTTGTGGNLSGFASALLNAFGVAPPLAGEAGTLGSALKDYGDFISAGNPSDDDNHPKGFITILVFDKNYNLVEAAWDQLDAAYVQSGGKKMPHDFLTKEVLIKEPGYVYIYLSNEGSNQQNIYFDDISLTFTHSPIVAGADYYPLGLVMENREITREDYRYGYQGQFSEKDLTTGWNEFELRMYDARIGRWISPDPYGQFASPYVGMGNSFVLGIDPDGGWWCCGGATATAIASGAGSAIGGAAAAVAATSSIWSSLAITLTSVATHVGDRLANGAVKTGNDIKQAYVNSGYFANSALHTITFGTWPKWKASGPGHQQQAYLQSAGQGFGEGVHVASAVGGGLNPRPSPVLVTPSGNVPITQPVVVAPTRVTDVHGQVNAGTQLNSKTLWKGNGKERIDVENPNPAQRPGQIHYQDNVGNKYIYDHTTGTFRNAPKAVNELLKDPKFKAAIEKGLRYLGL